jgi:hypothetical protein
MSTNLRNLLNRPPLVPGHTFGSRNSKRALGKKSSTSGLNSSAAPIFFVAAALISMAVLLLPALRTVSASNPAAGTLSPAGPSVTWNGMPADYANPASASEQNCQDGVNCDTLQANYLGHTRGLGWQVGPHPDRLARPSLRLRSLRSQGHQR